MIDPNLPSSSVFRRRIIGVSFATSLPALSIVLLGLLALIDLSAEQWARFFWCTAVYALLVTAPMAALQHRILAPICAYLDRRALGDVPPALRREAFAGVIDLPRRLALFGVCGWALPVVVVSLVMHWSYGARFGVFAIGVLAFSGFAAAVVAASFQIFLVKHAATPVRSALAVEIPDPIERRSLVRATSLRDKLLLCVTGVTIVPVFFAVLISQRKASDSLEDFGIRWGHGVLESLAARVDPAHPQRALAAARDGVGASAGSLDLALVDLGAAGGDTAGLSDDVLAGLRRALARGARRGDSHDLTSDTTFAWQRLDDHRILVATLSRQALRADAIEMWNVFALLLVLSTAVSLGLAWLLASDVGAATSALEEEAERMASGDLRRGRGYESEDELGDLWRSFEHMAAALRTTLGRVAGAADVVEATAGEVDQVGEAVAEVTESQVSGIRQAKRSMEAINGQVRGIADSSQALGSSVEETSSTILEMGAAGDELNETANGLSARVDEVSTSIEQMVRSVRHVSDTTETLSQAAEETSTSMEEMATSMREVDASAEEAAALSHRVVASADTGRAKVRQTIEGMDEIRNSTETADRVIKALAGRIVEIGAIIDVIDDVADETNLLALNAAIIAAQSGENGRAFSVVADEIRDLADRVLESTKEIGGLIGAVQEESTNAIGAIERGMSSVVSGVELSAEAGLSLEEITRASRESGTRIAGIVSAVREQARAAGHVVQLMERVRRGVDEIRAAAREQDRGNDVVYRGSVAMREVALQVRGTTQEQAKGSVRMREAVEEVSEAVERINSALQEQSTECRSAAEFLDEVYQRTQSNEGSVRRLDEATKALLKHAAALREDVHRFRI